MSSAQQRKHDPPRFTRRAVGKVCRQVHVRAIVDLWWRDDDEQVTQKDVLQHRGKVKLPRRPVLLTWGLSNKQTEECNV